MLLSFVDGHREYWFLKHSTKKRKMHLRHMFQHLVNFRRCVYGRTTITVTACN